ncbi:MAG: tetratricopeptide repeat protein [Anaerolineae bacterium]
MQTKLSVFCDKVIEAGWLAAVIVVPLFFNVYSDRVFEPDKLTLLRSIALMMVVAWIIKVLEVGSWRLEVGSGALSLSKGWKTILRTPLVLPTLLLAMVYMLATLASVTPRVSLWGSYQRLQGTYTTFSYIVIFFLALQGLRTREQIERVVTVAILVSLPISLYGILQHYGRDPLPWAADVTRRAASNMGNSIFVAAYLIMVVPLTLARVVESFSAILADEEGAASNVVLATCYVFILAAQLICIFFSQSRGPLMGLLAGLFSFVLLSLILLRQRAGDRTPLNLSDGIKAIATVILSGLAGFIIGMVGGALLGRVGFFSGAPDGTLLSTIGFFVGMASGVACIGFMVILRKGWKWLWLAWIIQALVPVAFLIVFNLPGSPIASWRDLPYVGRLGQVFETETGTGKVRVLIWEGVLEMMTPHEPIQYPSGQPDRLNPLRLLIGYGPESMYVAYNRFYPPDLAHVESRRASPDRSHNETFDALVITGLVGFVVYMLLFGSVFYYGYRWLGLIDNSRQRNVFIGLFLGGGLTAALFLWLWKGAKFVGVGLPLGIALGLAGYLVVSAIVFYSRAQEQESKRAGEQGGKGADLQLPTSNFQPPTSNLQFLLIALVSALLAHFVEIHFGIAIAATRTYFWVYTALMVATGCYLGREPISLQAAETVPSLSPPPQAGGEPKQPRRKRRRSRWSQAQVPSEPASQALRLSSVQAAQGRGASVIIYSLLAGLILVTMGFDYITPQFNLAAKGYSLLWLLALTWLLGGAIIVALTNRKGQSQRYNWSLASLLYLFLSLGCFLIFFIVRTRQMRIGITVASLGDLLKQAGAVANGLVLYYVFVLLFFVAIAGALLLGMSLPSSSWRRRYAWLYPLLVVGTAVLIFVTNLSVIKADIVYKHAKSYFEAGHLDAGIALYQEAIKLAPKEDYYYLFLGSAYLEKAKDVSNLAERSALLEESRRVLESALQLNPLNTDHSANLARLHRTWGEIASDSVERAEKLGKALEYYRQATNLSPHNAQLFNEWGLAYYISGDQEKALEKYQRSLSLDQEYDQTYLLLGGLYLNKEELDKAAHAYSKALELTPTIVEAHSALGYIYSQQGKLQEAVEENLKVLELATNDYASHKNLALLYQQLGRADEAVAEAQIALGLAPEGDKASLETFIAQLRPGQPITTSSDEGLIQTYLYEGQTYLNEKDFERAEEVYAKALELNPNIIQAHSALGYIYALQGKLQEALEENLKVLELAPNDYATHKNLAMIYQQLGRLEEAITEAEAALELAPESDRPALDTFIAQLRQRIGP